MAIIIESDPENIAIAEILSSVCEFIDLRLFLHYIWCLCHVAAVKRLPFLRDSTVSIFMSFVIIQPFRAHFFETKK